MNITEDKVGYHLSLAAPGLQKNDFNVDVNGNMLTISSEKEERKEEKDEKFTRQEYNFSSFTRSFTIPEDVQQDKIQAVYDAGVLKLTLPKNEKLAKEQNKHIPIK